MTNVVISMDTNQINEFLDLAKTNPREYEYQNLLLNMCAGLRYEHLSEDEKQLLREHGYEGEG